MSTDIGIYQRLAAVEGEVVKLLAGPVIRSVELLRPQPGDVVLLTIPDRAPAEARRNIAKAFQEACGPDVRIAVLLESMSVRVVRVADIPPAAIAGPVFEAQDASSSVSSNFSSLT